MMNNLDKVNSSESDDESY